MRLFMLSIVGCLAISVTSVCFAWPEPDTGQVIPYQNTALTHGPSLGAVKARSVRVWIRTADPTAFKVRYGTELPLDQTSSTVTGKTRGKRDHTGVVELTGLKPDTRYFYAIEIDGHLPDLRLKPSHAWPSFKTLPAPAQQRDPDTNSDGLFNLQFSAGSCMSLASGAWRDPTGTGGQYANPPAFDTLYQQYGDELDFHIFHGDVIYEEKRDGTIDGIYENYRLYWRRGRSWARFMRHVPTLFMHDDHEIGANLHGSGEPGMGSGPWLTRDIGVRAWQDYCGWANYDEPFHGRPLLGDASLKKGSRTLHDPDASFTSLDLDSVSTLHIGPYSEAPEGRAGMTAAGPDQKRPNAGVYAIEKIIDEHTLKLDRPVKSTNDNARYSIGRHVYFDWQVANCHFFMLDTRGERTAPNLEDYDDPTRSILGQAQKQWLIEGVRETDAEFIFIVSPGPFMVYHTGYHGNPKHDTPKGDGFASFLHERRELLKVLDQQSQPVMFITGDVHASAALQVTDNVWEFLVSPLNSMNHLRGTAGGESMPFGGSWQSQGQSVDLRWIGVGPNNVHYSRLRQPYFTVVQVNNTFKAPPPDNKPDQPPQRIAYDRPQVTVRFHDGYTGELLYAESVTAGND
jgi:phosphodiesterase/alkaline phosphatase D-like protein